MMINIIPVQIDPQRDTCAGTFLVKMYKLIIAIPNDLFKTLQIFINIDLESIGSELWQLENLQNVEKHEKVLTFSSFDAMQKFQTCQTVIDVMCHFFSSLFKDYAVFEE